MKRTANKKPTSVAVRENLVKKARKMFKASSNSEAVTKALRETLAKFVGEKFLLLIHENDCSVAHNHGYLG